MEKLNVERLSYIKDEHLEYLNKLRESGKTNMFGAVPYLLSKFRTLTRSQAYEVLGYWMATFEG